MNRKKVMNEMNSDRNFMFDFLKGIACIGVVFIHVAFPGQIGVIIGVLSRFAVPLFFMISGYFAYNEYGNAKNIIIRRAKKILRITIYSLFLYILFTLASCTYNHSLNYIIKLLSYISLWVKMLILGNFDVFYAPHLWFLPSLLYAYLVLYIVDVKNLYKLAYKCIPLLFILRILVCIITETFNMSWHLNSNFFVCALPYLLLGNYIAYNKALKNKWSNYTLIITIIVSSMLSVIWFMGNWKINITEIGTLVFSISLFIFANNNPQKSISKKVEILGSTYSLYVYIIHIIISSMIEFTSRIVGINSSIWYMWSKPILVVLVSIITSIIIQTFLRFLVHKNLAKAEHRM